MASMLVYALLASLLLYSYSFHISKRIFSKFSSFHVKGFYMSPKGEVSSASQSSLHMGKGFGGGGGGGFSSSSKEEKKASQSKMEKQAQDRQKAIAKISPEASSMKLDSNVKTASSSVGNHIQSVDVSYPGLEAIHGDPPVFVVNNVFSEATCASYITRAAEVGKKVSSATFNSASGSTRTSTTWYLPYDTVPELMEFAEKLTGIPRANYEEPQVVRYEMGQQFSWHYDTIPKSMQKASGNRRATLLIYLNSLPSSAGGATCFKDLNVQVKPELGKALLFFPTYKDGENDERTLHCGQVAMDTKYIAQIWIHEKAYESDMR